LSEERITTVHQEAPIPKSKKAQTSSYCASEGMCLGFLFAVCRAFYPIMRLVCLADSKLPCLHLLKYFVLQADCMMKEHLPKIELAYSYISEPSWVTL